MSKRPNQNRRPGWAEKTTADLLDDNWNFGLDHSCNFRDVPIGKPDASVAYIAPDKIGVARAMNSNALLIELDPYHAHWIVRPGRQKVEG